MAESPAQQRYRQDTVVLAEIGRHLRDRLPPVTVRLPADLAALAQRAWDRDEEESVDTETVEQAVVRSFAATLALIGLAVEQGDDTGDAVVVTLAPHEIAGCLFAAEHVEERWNDSGTGNNPTPAAHGCS